MLNLRKFYTIMTMERINAEKSYHQFRAQYPVFIYESYKISLSGNDVAIEFDFNIPGLIRFKPVSVFQIGNLIPNLDKRVGQIYPLLENIAFNIGMIELISYWKPTCSPALIVKSGHLTDEQKNWWKTLYYNGLGEFFYLNSIAPDHTFIQIEAEGPVNHQSVNIPLTEKFLIPIGGGKDSAVTLELIKNAAKEITPFIINPRGATIQTIEAAGIKMEEVLTMKRTIDSGLLNLNAQGFLNGHTPFSAMLAFYTLFASALTGIKNIALSNESSANEVTVPGTNINHQFSKSWEFESAFRDYYSRYISPDFNYFSFLRPLSELQIARIFSKLQKYHPVFKSCNAGSKNDSWCGKCPKCLFTHIMLGAFTGLDEADKILGKPLLADLELSPVFDELCGFSKVKPFECVGTTEEVSQALEMIAAKNTNQTHPILIDRYLKMRKSQPANPDFKSLNQQHFLSTDLLNLLLNHLQ